MKPLSLGRFLGRSDRILGGCVGFLDASAPRLSLMRRIGLGTYMSKHHMNLFIIQNKPRPLYRLIIAQLPHPYYNIGGVSRQAPILFPMGRLWMLYGMC